MSKKTSSAPSFAAELLQATDDNAMKIVASVGADEQADLVDAWVAAGNVVAVARVAAEDGAPAPARKAARRGLNVLKSRGVTVPEKSNVARPFVQAQTHSFEARFVFLEVGAQGSVITILRHTPGKDSEFVDVFFSDSVGIWKVGGGTLSASKLREWEAKRRFDRGYDPVTVPVEWARFRLAQASKQNAASGVLLPLDLNRYGSLLGPVPAADPGHPATQLGLEPAADAADRVTRSETLLFEPEFRAFILPAETLQDMLNHVGQRLSTLGRQPSQDEVEPILNEEKRSATDRFFQDAVRRQLAAQMLDAVPSVFQRAGKEKALDVLATREAILSAGLITQPPSEIPFLVALFDKTVSVAASQNNGQLSIPLAPRNPAAGPVLSQEQLAAVEAVRQG